MKNYQKRTITPEPVTCYDLVSITCDVCHKEFDARTDKYHDDIYEVQEFFIISRRCGYGSVFGDEDTIGFEICQNCMKEILIEKCGNVEQFINRGKENE